MMDKNNDIVVVVDEVLNYRGVKFDYYSHDDNGSWSGICEECLNRYKKELEGADVGMWSSGGVCGVKGCSSSDWDMDVEVYYINDIMDCV